MVRNKRLPRIEVMTPSGPGIIWGIDRGKVLVEMDYSYLVEFEPGDVERIELPGLYRHYRPAMGRNHLSGALGADGDLQEPGRVRVWRGRCERRGCPGSSRGHTPGGASVGHRSKSGDAVRFGPPPVNYGEGESVRKKLLYLLRLAVLKREILRGGAG